MDLNVVVLSNWHVFWTTWWRVRRQSYSQVPILGIYIYYCCIAQLSRLDEIVRQDDFHYYFFPPFFQRHEQLWPSRRVPSTYRTIHLTCTTRLLINCNSKHHESALHYTHAHIHTMVSQCTQKSVSEKGELSCVWSEKKIKRRWVTYAFSATIQPGHAACSMIVLS